MSEHNYELLKKEVDALQVQVMQGDRPWYKTPSTMVAVFALILSIITTSLSFLGSYNAELRANRSEVRGLIQRTLRLPLENFKLMKDFANDPQGLQLSGMLNQENTLLAVQAAEIVAMHPEIYTPIEKLSVANALQQANRLGDARQIYDEVLEEPKDADEYLFACRAYAGLMFNQGDMESARVHLNNALNAWEKFPNESKFFVATSNLETLIQWIGLENILGNGEGVQENMVRAFSMLEALPEMPVKYMFWNRLQEASKPLNRDVQ